MNINEAMVEGARNLVVNCAELKPGESVLIVHENPDLGWYDQIVPEAVAAEICKFNIEPSFLEVGAPSSESAAAIANTVSAHDCTLFFSRIGDQIRFDELKPGTRTVMCYARDVKMLASAYGRCAHQAFHDLKNAVNEILFAAEQIEITCPLGTKISGSPPATAVSENGDVSTRRFPLGVPKPMDAQGFSGRVALAHYLTPTGSRVYEPGCVRLDETIFAEVERGRIIGFEGNDYLVERVRNHYINVANQLGIDPGAVHSWHAGIHPGCTYTDDAAIDPDRWSNTVFTNPRFLHFHTCGSYAPGEICWMVLDHTITVNGVKLWEQGRLHPQAFSQSNNCLQNWPELIDLFAHPSDLIGIAV